MHDFPQLNSKRLLLKGTDISDVPSMVTHLNNQKISSQLLNIPFPYTEADAIKRLEFINNGFKNQERFVFSIHFKEKNGLIGQMGLHLDKENDRAEIGYWVAEDYWGRGIASEALHCILKFGFDELKLHKIYATHYPDNPSSGKVLLKNQMIRECELKDHYKINGEYKSVIQYRLTKEEYQNLK